MPKTGKLFEPINIGTLEIKNRIALSPMATAIVDEEDLPTDEAMAFYFRRAEGGAGLVMIQPGTVLPEARCIKVIPFHDDKFISRLGKIAAGVKQRGARVSFELVHHGAHLGVGGQQVRNREQIKVIGPSPVLAPGSKIMPKEMTQADIDYVIAAFAAAALRAKKAGYDAIQVQLANGFLLHQFRSRVYNRRSDGYGGSPANRARMACEVIAAVRKNVGRDFPIIARMTGNDHSENGITLEESLVQAPLFVEAGADALDITGGSLETKDWIFSAYFMPPMLNLGEAEAIRKVVKVPVMVAGRMAQDIKAAEKAVRDGRVDMITIGRALIADPDIPKKVFSGLTKDIRPCLSCNECHRGTSEFHHIRCSVNGAVGREIGFGSLRPAGVKKKVLVVGGGPGGMEAARIAATRGHDVILCERYRQLGGLMAVGAVHNDLIAGFSDWLSAELKKLSVDIRLGDEVTPALVKEIAPDVVVFAGGGSFVMPDIPGIDGANVFSAHDLLDVMNGVPVNKGVLKAAGAFSPLARRFATPETVRRLLATNFPVKHKVAVIGAQFPGCSLAIALAGVGKEVTMIEESDHFGEGMEKHIMMKVQSHIREGSVKVMTSTKINEITDKGITVTDMAGKQGFVEAGSVIVALDLAPSKSRLPDEIKGAAKEIYTIGDANSFGRIIKAVSDGYEVAFNL